MIKDNNLEYERMDNLSYLKNETLILLISEEESLSKQTCRVKEFTILTKEACVT